MNEELESTNTELQTINTELQERSIQLNRVKYLPGTDHGQPSAGCGRPGQGAASSALNRRAEDLWGVKANETIGQPVLGLDIGLPLNELAIPIKKCLSNGDGFQELTVQATNRRGKSFTCRVQCTAVGGSMEAAA